VAENRLRKLSSAIEQTSAVVGWMGIRAGRDNAVVKELEFGQTQQSEPISAR